MIYIIVVALGFATVENIGALINQFNKSQLLANNEALTNIIGTITLRFVAYISVWISWILLG